MEKRKNILDYIGQVFCVFGISMLIMAVICTIFGESEKEYSRMFRLGSEGLPIDTMLQFLGVSAFTVLMRFVFFTDAVIKKMSVAVRTACILFSIIVVISGVIIVFDWFPADMWEPWVLFFLCFGVSAGVSVMIMFIKEKLENKQMEQALKKAQDELQK